MMTKCGEGQHRMPDGTCMDDDTMAITAAVRSDWSGLSLAPDGREWDKGAAVRRLVDWADGDISGKYARAFIWRDPDGDPDLQGTYKLPVADLIDGELTIVPNAVRNVASRLEQTQGLTRMTSSGSGQCSTSCSTDSRGIRRHGGDRAEAHTGAMVGCG
jgi:hypothetical protein